jgi:hypothetical protein
LGENQLKPIKRSPPIPGNTSRVPTKTTPIVVHGLNQAGHGINPESGPHTGTATVHCSTVACKNNNIHTEDQHRARLQAGQVREGAASGAHDQAMAVSIEGKATAVHSPHLTGHTPYDKTHIPFLYSPNF